MFSRKVPFAGVRKAITQRLSPGFHQALPVALMMEFKADPLLDHRKQRGRPSITSYAVKAAALALKKYPDMNVTFEEGELIYHDEVNIAVGVHTPRGLRAPVIRNVDKMTLNELTRIIDEFAEKGERGEITLADQEGHSFTVTNLGMTGVTHFTPIINPPDCSILGLGAIIAKPIVVDNKLELGKVGHLTLVFDHRVIDGMPASIFLGEIKRLLENPVELE
ncbi:MAG: 2-oxo acid dehydrogenase subunit E2 [Candidatus Bathyarchaeia archaeon]